MIEWLAGTFVAVTILMLLVLAVRGPVARLFGAGWAYALWSIPALRLILPPLPQISPDIELPAAIIFIPAAAGMAAPLPATDGVEQWLPFAIATWAGGAVIFLILQWLSYRAFLHRLGASSRPARPPSYGGIRMVESEVVDGPVAVGLLERRIVVPNDFSRRYSPEERRLAMEHELVHHRRGDIWWNVAAIVVLALNWFNPLAWVAFRAFRADQELACDAAVAAGNLTSDRHDYARALVKSASRPGLVAACPLNRADQLKHRLKMIGRHRVSRSRTAGGAFAFTILTAACLASASFGSSPASMDGPVVYAAAPVVPKRLSAPMEQAALVTPPAMSPHSAKAGEARVPKPVVKPKSVGPAATTRPSAVPVHILVKDLGNLREVKAPIDLARWRVIRIRAASQHVAQAEAGIEQARAIAVRAALGPEQRAELEADIEQALARLERARIRLEARNVREALRAERERVRSHRHPAARPASAPIGNPPQPPLPAPAITIS